MQPYANVSGKSGVVEFDITPAELRVRFENDPTIYVYNPDQPGPHHFAEMSRLAVLGQGLATYINQHVRSHYARKE